MSDAFPWYRKSHRAWFVSFRGKVIRLHADKREAIQLWHRLEAGVEQPKKSGPVLSALVDVYLDQLKGKVKKVTFASKRDFLSRLRITHGEVDAEKFNERALLAFLDKPSWGQSTRHLAFATVKAMLRFAVKEGLLKSNPLADVKVKPALSRGAESIVSPETHAKLMQVADPEYRAFLTALYETGARPSEVCSVEARHFDAGAACWILDSHKTADKTGKVRVIYLSPKMVDLCADLARRYPSGKLFRLANGSAFKPGLIRNWLLRQRKVLGLGKIIAYGYRHGFATSALAHGVPDAQVAELLGHSGTTMLHKHYSHLGARADALRNALGMVRE